MGFSFFPKVVRFYDLLVEQNAKMIQAVTVLEDVFADLSDVPAKCKRINEIEAEGDRISREITRQLSQTFITPIDKEDIHELNLVQEEVQDIVKMIATRIQLYGFTEVKQSARSLSHNLKGMADLVGRMLTEVIDRKGVQELGARIRELKEGTEGLLLCGLAEIYDKHGGSTDGLIDVIKWTQIYDRIAEAIHHTAALAGTLEGISLKYA